MIKLTREMNGVNVVVEKQYMEIIMVHVNVLVLCRQVGEMKMVFCTVIVYIPMTHLYMVGSFIMLKIIHVI